MLIEVAVPLPLERTFAYQVPAELCRDVSVGVRVLVPFGRQTISGFVVGMDPEIVGELRDVLEVLDSAPLFTAADLRFYRWVADYYQHPLGEVIKAALPAGLVVKNRHVCPATQRNESPKGKVKTENWLVAVADAPVSIVRGKALELLAHVAETGPLPLAQLRQKFGPCSALISRLRQAGLVKVEAREVYRDPFRHEVYTPDQPHQLNEDQAAALHQLISAAAAGIFAPFLLYGITGSGKTEVYLQAISTVIAAGKTALVLVPEISLTPQLVGRFKRRFDCGIAVLHSGLSDGERYDEWRRISRGEATIVIGARSAIFAPLANLGMVVVDEEHEASYKQADGLRYNARDLALVRGKFAGAVVIMGSATPLVTTWHAAQAGRLTCLDLPKRVANRPLPDVLLIDQRGRRDELFSPELSAALLENFANGGQSLLFLNRRGFATYLLCRDCGEALHCPNCAVTLTYHQRRGRHVCHYCDYWIPAPSICPKCSGGEFVLLGRGTERVEEALRELLPTARIARMDRDTTTGKGSVAAILQKVEQRQLDLLVGTQMIAKGHDFPGVTLVGVISADESLNLPDFRSAERAFQLITQVLGRAGRGDQPGRVIIQTLNPEHYAVARAVAHDFAGFCSEELAFRRDIGYPPFMHLAVLVLSGTAGAAVAEAAANVASMARSIKASMGGRVQILGAVPAPLAKVRNRYRWLILLKAGSRGELHQLVRHLRQRLALPATVRIAIDLDPVDML